jgi:di/tricarboxylate transporter
MQLPDLKCRTTNWVAPLTKPTKFDANGMLPEQAIDKSGLGERIANIGVYALGKTSLGLAYGLGLAETALSPAMPSTTARAGGVFVPIIISLARNVNSFASKSPHSQITLSFDGCSWVRVLNI